MYLGDTLSGVSEFVWPNKQFLQSAVDARWRELGQDPPAPLIPATMVNKFMFPTRGPRMIADTPSGKKTARPVNAAENDFLNFWNKAAVDPYHKQSGIAKVAGGILKVAAVAIPVFQYVQAGADAANAVSALNSQGSDAKLAERVLTPAYEAQAQKEDAASKADFDSQIKALQSLVPRAAGTPATAPALNAPGLNLSPLTAAPARAPWSMLEISLAALLGGALLLGVARR